MANSDRSDATMLLEKIKDKQVATEYSYIWNGLNFGRGGHHIKCRRYRNCMNVRCWKICGEHLMQLPVWETGMFCDNEAYIVIAKPCSKYRVPQDFGETLFYWKGFNAIKGSTPLPPEVEHDQPVQRICQWSEPPAFLRLFCGRMLVYSRKEQDKPLPSLILMSGETQDEVRLYEVPCEKRSLRSKSCMFLIDVGNNQIIIWVGSKASESSKDIATAVDEILLENTIFRFSGTRTITKQDEGSESVEFMNIVGGDYADYFNYREIDFLSISPKLFYFHTITGSFDVTSITNIYKSIKWITRFPFLQSHLTTVSDPALFLLDASYRVWIWCSCTINEIPEERSEEYASHLQTVKDIGEMHSKNQKYLVGIEVITSGNEPTEFTNLFPYWEYKQKI